MDIEKFLSAEDYQYKHLEFDVGMPMLMFLTGIEAPLKTTFIGAVADEYIVISLPRHDGVQNHLTIGGVLKIVYMFAGTVFAFGAKLLDVRGNYPEHLVLSYPGKLHRHELRQANRVGCFVPGRLTCEDGDYDCMILDLSTGGCKIAIQFSDGFPDNVKKNSRVAVRFQLIGMAEPGVCRGEVRNVSQDRRKLSLGIQFQQLDEEVKLTIEKFIKNLFRYI